MSRNSAAAAPAIPTTRSLTVAFAPPCCSMMNRGEMATHRPARRHPAPLPAPPRCACSPAQRISVSHGARAIVAGPLAKPCVTLECVVFSFAPTRDRPCRPGPGSTGAKSPQTGSSMRRLSSQHQQYCIMQHLSKATLFILGNSLGRRSSLVNAARSVRRADWRLGQSGTGPCGTVVPWPSEAASTSLPSTLVSMSRSPASR
jgi:hypothetical protein